MLNQQNKSGNTAIRVALDGKQYVVAESAALIFDFDASAVLFERSEDALVLKSSGGVTTLSGFFSQKSAALPDIQLGDNQWVNARVFLSEHSPELDTTTAVGPQSSPPSGGTGDYADDGGTLIGGLDRLGTLGTDYWTGGRPFAQADGKGFADTGADGGLESPLPPKEPEDGGTPEEPGNANSRIVLMLDTERLDASDSTQFSVVAEAQHKWNPFQTGSVLPVWAHGSVSLTGEGKLVFTLAAEYESAVKAGERLVDLVAYIDADGEKHTIEVVITGDPTFLSTDPAFLSAAPGLSSDVAYETHHGNLPPDTENNFEESYGYGYWVKGGGGNDHYSYSEPVRGDLAAGMGDDTLVFDNGVDYARVSGDSAEYDAAPESFQVGDDTIHITGNVSNNSLVSGDNEHILGHWDAESGAQGGNDTITVDGDVTGASNLAGDSGGEMHKSVGGNDIITVSGNVDSGSVITGDAGWGLYDSSVGGDDTIRVGSLVAGEFDGDIRGADAKVSGDAGGMENSRGGNDIITVDGAVSGNGMTVSGDAADDMRMGSTGGNDKIVVGSVENGGCVAGDAGKKIYENSAGGNDALTVGHVGEQGSVYGDAEGLSHDSRGGDDTLVVENMHGGSVYGDANYIENGGGGEPAKGGADHISIETISSGEVFGDWEADYSSNAVAGNDTIRIGTMALADEGSILIDGSGGDDLFIYDNDAGNTLNLDDSGSVSIEGITGTDVVVRGFEGLGGGAGNDVITGNSGNNTLLGGAGDDILTGGGGSDTFVWQATDIVAGAHARDVITDFSIGLDDNADVLDLSSLLASLSNPDVSYSNGSEGTVISISGNGFQQDIVLSGQYLGTGTGLEDLETAVRIITG